MQQKLPSFNIKAIQTPLPEGGGHFVITSLSQVGHPSQWRTKSRLLIPSLHCWTQPFSSLKNINQGPSCDKNQIACHCRDKECIKFSSIFFRKLFFFCYYRTVSFYKTWLKIVHSAASGCAQRVIIIDVTGFDKPPFHTPSDISPCLARGIPNFFVKPSKIIIMDVQST